MIANRIAFIYVVKPKDPMQVQLLSMSLVHSQWHIAMSISYYFFTQKYVTVPGTFTTNITNVNEPSDLEQILSCRMDTISLQLLFSFYKI